MAITSTSIDINGNTIINVNPESDSKVTLATAGTYVDKNIVFNIDLSEKANIESPEFTGTPTAPTADGTEVSQIANVEFVQSLISKHDHELIYVNDYGLVNDGITDNLETFNTVYAAHPHAILIFTGGTYCFSGQIDTYDTHIILMNTTIKFTGVHGYGFNMMGYNREDVIGTIDTITNTEPKEYPSYGEFLKGIDGTIDGNYTAGTSLITPGTGSYFEISGLTIKNVGSADATSSQYAILGTSPNAVGYQYERLVKDIKIINYDGTIPNTVGLSGFGDSYISNIVIINMRTAINAGDVSVYYENIHIWGYPWNSSWSNKGTIGIRGDFIGSNIYLDSIDYGFYESGTGRKVKVNNVGWYVNSGCNDGKEAFMFIYGTDGSNMEIRGIDIRNCCPQFSSTQFTSGIFTGYINPSLAMNNIPTTFNFKHKADLNSPALTGIPTAPTADTGTSTTQLATTEFVQNTISTIQALSEDEIDTIFDEEVDE